MNFASLCNIRRIIMHEENRLGSGGVPDSCDQYGDMVAFVVRRD